MNLTKSNYQIHFFFISFIAVHYLISIIFFGQIIIEPHDNLDILVVYDHVISKIYRGDFEKISYFLSGEIKWYNFDKLFYPINILHYLLDDKLFYFTNDILKKLFSYFFFFLLAKSLNSSNFNSALGGILYTTLTYIKMPLGMAIPFLPYILYLLLNKDTLEKKHYFFLFLIGLNSSLIEDIFAFILLIPLSFILGNRNKNLRIYLQVFLLIFVSSTISNIHLVIGSVIGDPIHSEFWDTKNNYILLSFLDTFKAFFYINMKDPLFIFYIPLTIFSVILLIISIPSKQKNIKLFLSFIFLILCLKSILGTDLIDKLFIGIFEILKGFNFQRVDRIIPLTFTILFILIIYKLKNNNLKKLLYFISIISVLFIHLKTPIPAIGYYSLKDNMNSKKFNEVKISFLEKEYVKFFKILFDKKNYNSNKKNFTSSLNRTFDTYYKFEDYAFIKSLVQNSRIMSVGLDPMVAVMNDIKVIDGYHTIYPLSYKIKFRKIIEKELDQNIELKNYYDDWGSRVYAFYNDKNNILLDFQSAKLLGADYVISRFPINNNKLKIICYKCNNSNNIFLYKII